MKIKIFCDASIRRQTIFDLIISMPTLNSLLSPNCLIYAAANLATVSRIAVSIYIFLRTCHCTYYLNGIYLFVSRHSTFDRHWHRQGHRAGHERPQSRVRETVVFGRGGRKRCLGNSSPLAVGIGQRRRSQRTSQVRID